jgi:hypothetical protein
MKSDARPLAAPLEARACRPHVDEDVALGCECADPWLQIERWGQEMQASPFDRS